MAILSNGAFFNRHDLQLQTVILLEDLPDRLFVQKKWREKVVKQGVLHKVLGRPAVTEYCGCLFYHLTGVCGKSKAFHEARRRFGFPLAFSEQLISLYDNSLYEPAPLAREMIRTIKPGTNLHLVTRQYANGDGKDRTWEMLKYLLDFQASAQRLAA